MKADRFRIWAPIYERVSAIYSGGAVARAKACQTRFIQAGDHVVYAGVGCGGEVHEVLSRGARVTALDRSAAMLHRLAESADEHARLELVQSEVLDWRPDMPAEVLVTNFFLNTMGAAELAEHLDHLARWVKPGGLWLIADFAPPHGVLYPLHLFYWYLPLLPASRLTGETVHPYYDYIPLLEQRGFKVEEVLPTRLMKYGPAWFRSIVARKEGPFPTTKQPRSRSS